MFTLKKCILLALVLPFLVGCGQKEYYQAVKEQNITMQLRMENERATRADRSMRQDRETIVLIEKLALSTGKTKTPHDDFMAAMMLMMVQDKSNMSDLAYNLTKKDMQLQTIQAPDTVGDIIQKSTGLVLGGAGLTLGIMQSNNMKDIAVAGMNAAGTHNNVSGTNNTLNADAFKSGSSNTVTAGGNSSISGGTVDDGSGVRDDETIEDGDLIMPISCEGAGYYEDGDWWVSSGCSCDSFQSGHCGV